MKYNEHMHTLPCCVENDQCWGDVVGHHLKKGMPAAERGGMGLKPHDKWMVPLCVGHHGEIHDHGHDTFELKYGVRLVDIAAICWGEWDE